jgi:hypothetical protein
MPLNPPDRSNNRTKYYVTNGGMGTDNTRIYSHDLGSRQGRAAMKRAVDSHADRTGKPSWAYTESRKYDESSQRIQYKSGE